MDELLRTISARELAEWQAFSQLEPWGSHTEFYRTGIIASAVLNVHRDPKLKPVMPTDFVPKEETRPVAGREPDDPRTRKARLELVFTGRIERK